MISDSPNTRYSIGILYTKENKMNADNNDSSRVEEQGDNADKIENSEIEIDASEEFVAHKEAVSPSDEENLDEEVGLATQNMPSSLGITFLLKVILTLLIAMSDLQHTERPLLQTVVYH